MNSYLETLGEPGTTWAWSAARFFNVGALGLVIVAVVVVLLVRFLRSKAPRGLSPVAKGLVAVFALALVSMFLVWPIRRPQGRRQMQLEQESTYKAVRSRNLFGESVAIPSAGCDGDREVVYHLRDPLKEWQRQSLLPDAARPRIEPPSSGATATISGGPGSPPAWVADAGGSSPFSLRLGCVSIIGRRPGPTGELAGYSPVWQPDLEQAEADADRSVVEQLSAVLLRKLAIRAEEAPELSSESLLIDDLLDLIEVRARVATDDLLVDRFVEVRTRNYVGSSHKLYREAKLIRVSEERLAELTDAIVEDVHHASARLADARRHTLWTLAAAAGLALVAFLLYSFINAGTKGYFAWPLRIVSLGALVLLYVSLFYFRGWIH